MFLSDKLVLTQSTLCPLHRRNRVTHSRSSLRTFAQEKLRHASTQLAPHLRTGETASAFAQFAPPPEQEKSCHTFTQLAQPPEQEKSCQPRKKRTPRTYAADEGSRDLSPPSLLSKYEPVSQGAADRRVRRYAREVGTQDDRFRRRSGTVVAVDLDIIIRQIAAPGRSSVLALVNVDLNGDFVCGEILLC